MCTSYLLGSIRLQNKIHRGWRDASEIGLLLHLQGTRVWFPAHTHTHSPGNSSYQLHPTEFIYQSHISWHNLLQRIVELTQLLQSFLFSFFIFIRIELLPKSQLTSECRNVHHKFQSMTILAAVLEQAGGKHQSLAVHMSPELHFWHFRCLSVRLNSGWECHLPSPRSTFTDLSHTSSTWWLLLCINGTA